MADGVLAQTPHPSIGSRPPARPVMVFHAEILGALLCSGRWARRRHYEYEARRRREDGGEIGGRTAKGSLQALLHETRWAQHASKICSVSTEQPSASWMGESRRATSANLAMGHLGSPAYRYLGQPRPSYGAPPAERKDKRTQHAAPAVPLAVLLAVVSPEGVGTHGDGLASAFGRGGGGRQGRCMYTHTKEVLTYTFPNFCRTTTALGKFGRAACHLPV